MELKALEEHLKTLDKKTLIELYTQKYFEFDYYVSDLRDEIKELEQQAYPAYKREHEIRANLENIEVPRLRKENEQLKQSQKQLAISELEKLKDFFLEPYGDEKMGTEFLITTKNTGKIAEYVLDRIKSLKGE